MPVARSAAFFVALSAVLIKPLPAQADPASDVFAALKYRAVGPAISGGRTTAVAGSDADPRVYYAGGAAGGVFKSTDGGVSWTAIFDAQTVAPIGAIAVARHNPNDVWVGTGESNPRNTVEEGSGIWHSTDGGKTWKHCGLDDAGSISSISLDPRDPRTVVVGVLGHIFRDSTTRGVYVTRDGGASWSRTLYVGPSSGASDVERFPDHPSSLFAGIWQLRRTPWTLISGGPLGGLYRSDDSGASWRKLTGHGLPGGLTGRIGIAAGTAGRVYAIIQSRAGDIWRSDDGGSTWRVMPHSPLVGARPFYFSKLYVDPRNRERVINVSLILSLSTDGAHSFHKIATNAGWDYHANWWAADGRRIINGNDEGVVLSADGGANWSQPYDLPISQAYHVGFDDTLPSYRICTGLQDNNSWCGPSTADNGIGVLNRDWTIVGPGDGMHALFDPADKNLVWTTATNSDPGQVYLYDARTQQASDVSPSAQNSEVAPAQLPYRFNWDTPIAFAHDGKVLAGGNVLFESADRGVHWTVISPDLTRNDKARQGVSGGPITPDASGAEMYDTILSIAPSKLQPGLVWIGTDDGLVQLTQDGGKTWRNVTPPAIPAWSRVYTIEPGNASAGTAYVAVDDHMNGDDRPYLFATPDYGATWTPVVGDLPPNQFVRAIREDPRDANLLYAGTQRGVWVTFDRGRRWHALRLNMPATPIYDLAIQPQRNDLIVASHGRGIWILDDLRPLQQFAAAQSSDIDLFQPIDAYRTWQAAPVNAFLDSSLPGGDFVGDNRTYGALITYYLARPASNVAIEVVDAKGRAIKHLSGKNVTGHTGMNRIAWNLTEDGPAQWNGTFEQNRGPKVGAEALPGPYTIRLVVDGKTRAVPLVVRADPRDPAPAAASEERHALLTELNAELGGVDAMLNAIDARLKNASPAQASELNAFKHRLTMDPRNIEDLKVPVQLRERLLDLLSRVGSTSYQAPNAAQTEEAATLRAAYQAVSAEYAGLK
jgi:photosystem II stability/assembly factor-like uncharacterized protein